MAGIGVDVLVDQGVVEVGNGVTGADAEGESLRELYEQQQINCMYLLACADRITTNKTRIISRNQQMMRLLADSHSKQDIGAEVDAMDEAAFRARLQDITDEAVRFLDATQLANDSVFQAMLEQSLFAITRKLKEFE